jgi:hypothetical protein
MLSSGLGRRRLQLSHGRPALPGGVPSEIHVHGGTLWATTLRHPFLFGDDGPFLLSRCLPIPHGALLLLLQCLVRKYVPPPSAGDRYMLVLPKA